MQIEGAVCVVTVGASGIGRALARELASRGAAGVVVADRIGGLAVACDVGDPAQVEALVAAATERYGRVDVFCSNAGYSDPVTFDLSLPFDELERITRVNLSPSITGTEPDDPPEVQFRTVGRPQAGMEVEIADGHEAGEEEGVGRVRVRGACVMRGYWGDPELTAATIDADGWLTSTDLGVLRPDGNLVLVGRTSDMYIRGGYNVHPLEVENVLAEHPSVDRAAVVGLPTPVIGEIGVAFVTLTPGAVAPTLPEIRTWVAARLADYKAPDRLEVLDALPLTAMMKIDKTALLAHAARTTDREH